jgi:DNA-binding MarR family transcriptional regulator
MNEPERTMELRVGPSEARVRALLSFYYPMHYRIGMELETIMGQGRISRQQAAMLWLLHSRADPDGWMRRKVIETRLSSWFEISNSNISRLLRELSQPPLSLVAQAENPASGREKVVRLTESGQRFVEEMIAASTSYLSGQLSHLSDEELGWGIGFLALSFGKPADGAVASSGDHSLEPPPQRIERMAAFRSTSR